MMDALEAGADDMRQRRRCALSSTPILTLFNDVVAALEAKGYTFTSAEVEMVPQNYYQAHR